MRTTTKIMAGLAAVAVASVVAPTASEAATHYFSTTKIITKTVTSPASNPSSTQTVTCPSGYKVVSGGFKFASGVDVVMGSYPTSSTTWAVTIRGLGGYSNTWTMYAVCVD